MSKRANHLYEFGPFVLDPTERTLQRDGKPVPLQPKVFDKGKGRLDEAQKKVDEISVKYPNEPFVKLEQAFLSALKGDFRTTEEEVSFMLSDFNPKNFAYHHATYDIACLYALGGKSDEAVKWLRKTAAEGFPSYTLFQRDPYLNRIRQAPEFIRFMEEMKARHERYRREFS